MISNKKNNYEFLTVVVVCLILSAIVLVIAIRNSQKEKFVVFSYNAKTMGINAVDYEFRNSDDSVYLYEMINDGLITEIKNNFSGDEFCDLYQSKVEFVDDKKLVTLQCGKYLIYKQDISEENYNIYKVGNWSFDEKTGNNVDVINVYSLKKNGNYLFDGYYEEDLFVKLVANNYGKKYTSLSKIKQDFKVASKKAYRKRVLVS